MPAGIFDFASFNFHVPMNASSAATHRAAATNDSARTNRIILTFMILFISLIFGELSLVLKVGPFLRTNILAHVDLRTDRTTSCKGGQFQCKKSVRFYGTTRKPGRPQSFTRQFSRIQAFRTDRFYTIHPREMSKCYEST